jgi:hypothetical protein
MRRISKFLIVLSVLGLIGGGAAFADGDDDTVATDDVETSFEITEVKNLKTQTCGLESDTTTPTHTERVDFYKGTIESDDARLQGDLYLWAKTIIETGAEGTGDQDVDPDDGVTAAKVVITETGNAWGIKAWGGLLGVNEDSNQPSVGATDAEPHLEGTIVAGVRSVTLPDQTVLPSGALVGNFTADTDDAGVLRDGVIGSEDSSHTGDPDSYDNSRERFDFMGSGEDDGDNPAIIQTGSCDDDDHGDWDDDHDGDDWDDDRALINLMPRRYKKLF